MLFRVGPAILALALLATMAVGPFFEGATVKGLVGVVLAEGVMIVYLYFRVETMSDKRE